MQEKCYAPVFSAHRPLACVYLMIIYTIVIVLLMISLIWLTAEGRCLIKQYGFRMTHCREGNSDLTRLI
jgi:hypothetical protein